MKRSSLRQLEAKRERLRSDLLPIFTFFVGLFFAPIFSEYFTVVREMAKEEGAMQYTIYRWVILLLTPYILFMLFQWIRSSSLIRTLEDMDAKMKRLEKIRKN